MRRRKFITLLGAGAAAWPLLARAQQPGRTYRLGFFLPAARDAPAIIAFFDELRVHGFVEGQNLAIIPGGFEAGNQQIDDLVPALIKAAPDAIIAGGDVIPRALQNATRTIPIVVITEDMVAAGFAASLARPGSQPSRTPMLRRCDTSKLWRKLHGRTERSYWLFVQQKQKNWCRR